MMTPAAFINDMGDFLLLPLTLHLFIVKPFLRNSSEPTTRVDTELCYNGGSTLCRKSRGHLINAAYLYRSTLWVALDKCATYHEDLLNKYDPGFPSSLFNPLLLPKKLQVERLARVEQYLTQRRERSIHKSSLIFQDIKEENSLAVQYFGQSLHHRDLRREIEDAAKIEREQKKEELREKRRQYNRLMQEFDSMSCEFITQWCNSRRSSYHSHDCRRCDMKCRAENLEITVHEWPLPERDLEARSVVFELDVPTVIAKWRDVTYSLLVDVFSPPISQSPRKSPKIYCLQDFCGLRKFVRSQTGRLRLVSTAKPFVVTHYSRKEIPQANEANICVNHGLCYSMYDSTSNQWTTELLNRCNVLRICTFSTVRILQDNAIRVRWNLPYIQ